MDIHRKSIVSRSTPDIFKIFMPYRQFKRSNVINAKNLPILCKQECRLQMHLKSVGCTDTVLFLTNGNAINLQTPDIGKLDIYR